MAVPLRNAVLEKVKEAGSMTDAELSKALTKEGHMLPPDRFNKVLLDLEILGLIRVAWITRDEKRIEAVAEEGAGGDGGEDGQESERDYEASFPGYERDQ